MSPARFHTLISANELAALGPQVFLIDARFDLADTEAGEHAYAQAHLPGAHYLHLDRDLSGPRQVGEVFRGRHPLPEREAFAQRLRTIGMRQGQQVVAYDGTDGMYAARVWWMLRWLGHEAVAVLDGGLRAWQTDGLPLSSESPSAEPGDFQPRPPLTEPIDASPLLASLGRVRVLDARAPERYRGEVEPLDRLAGHIPGALNRFFKANLQPDGRFRPAAELRADFTPLLSGLAPAQVVHQCGSGVTACHNLLAMEHAGLTGSRLYPGSWSEWSAQPGLPVARG